MKLLKILKVLYYSYPIEKGGYVWHVLEFFKKKVVWLIKRFQVTFNAITKKVMRQITIQEKSYRNGTGLLSKKGFGLSCWIYIISCLWRKLPGVRSAGVFNGSIKINMKGK